MSERSLCCRSRNSRKCEIKTECEMWKDECARLVTRGWFILILYVTRGLHLNETDIVVACQRGMMLSFSTLKILIRPVLCPINLSLDGQILYWKDIWIDKLWLMELSGTHSSYCLLTRIYSLPLPSLGSASLKQSYFQPFLRWTQSNQSFWNHSMFVGLFPLLRVDHTSVCPSPGPKGVTI